MRVAPLPFDKAALEKMLPALRKQLLASRVPGGYWAGELSSSALSTATAICALALVDKNLYEPLIHRGLAWLARNCNADGGWGDTVLSASNISTTALCWAAFGLSADLAGPFRDVLARTEGWLTQRAGRLEPEGLAKAIMGRYGQDKTFSSPILTNCALAGRLGEGREAWRWVSPLPFELAALPQRWYKWLHLPVVSYALPALIAVGLVQHHHCPALNPLKRWLRHFSKRRTLRILAQIQPASGGFLEATPLTSFVVMSLAACGYRNHQVVSRGVTFLTASVRGDGSWPIDTNLSTWVTTLSVNALAANREFLELLTAKERDQIGQWLLGQQYSQEHPYTLADPGGWAWTDLAGGVPDADDTAGVLLALRNLGQTDERVIQAVTAGVNWLMGLQNRDGGLPTFCKGWGSLPFDRSSPDITAHGLLALSAWLQELPLDLKPRAQIFLRKGIDYLAKVQRKDGSWVPLWFGNQAVAGEVNPTYGTSRVLRALQELAKVPFPGVSQIMVSGIQWLLSARNSDGGWGGAAGVPSSIEETALAVDALAGIWDSKVSRSRTLGNDSRGHVESLIDPEALQAGVFAGVSWLIKRTEGGKRMDPSPIGCYFAKLWYFERLYPLIFTVAALEKVQNVSAAHMISRYS